MHMAFLPDSGREQIWLLVSLFGFHEKANEPSTSKAGWYPCQERRPLLVVDAIDVRPCDMRPTPILPAYGETLAHGLTGVRLLVLQPKPCRRHIAHETERRKVRMSSRRVGQPWRHKFGLHLR